MAHGMDDYMVLYVLDIVFSTKISGTILLQTWLRHAISLIGLKNSHREREGGKNLTFDVTGVF